MNVLQFIATLIANDTIKSLNARNAFDLFVNMVGEEDAGTYPYFRTQFNNACKRLNIKPTLPPSFTPTNREITIPEISEEAQIIYDNLPTRLTHNYMNNTEILSIPDLMPTGTIFDEVISDRITTEEDKEKYFEKFGEEMPDDKIEIGGFTRQCVDIVAGDPGAGKTFSRNILAVKAKIFAAREKNENLIVHFISGEMRKSEWAKELNGSELLKMAEVTYMLDYVGQPNYEEVFWDAFSYGDIIICDSLPAILSHFRMSWPANKGKMPTETQMIYDFIRKSLKSVEENNNNVQLINQANKDGNYKGGTELPHMMSSMSFVRLDGLNRYIIFTKNRNNGKVKRKLFFSKTETGDIEFNEEAYNATYKKVEDRRESLDEFINRIDSEKNKTEAVEELEEESIIDDMDVPEHLAPNLDEDLDYEIEETPRGSMFGRQLDLEEVIEEVTNSELNS